MSRIDIIKYDKRFGTIYGPIDHGDYSDLSFRCDNDGTRGV